MPIDFLTTSHSVHQVTKFALLPWIQLSCRQMTRGWNFGQVIAADSDHEMWFNAPERAPK